MVAAEVAVLVVVAPAEGALAPPLASWLRLLSVELSDEPLSGEAAQWRCPFSRALSGYLWVAQVLPSDPTGVASPCMDPGVDVAGSLFDPLQPPSRGREPAAGSRTLLFPGAGTRGPR